ncbi:ABC transporter substrate-binding protein [Salinirubrum litoreum]|uniref:ABC transporter substrate-binding protein n=1 Tax=Salinirubrum litoreum TaxID=1126234 RepID=A0ABD5R980_9EURY|nr:ABC transporter substrate-binding protein [Salinirubrum litoreum]
MPTPPHSRRRFLQTAGTVALASGLAGCFGDDDSPDTDDRTTPPATHGPGSSDTDEPDDESPGRDLRLVSTGYRTLDPVAASDPASVAVVSKLYEGLTTFPAGVPDPEPLLAEQIDVTDAGRTYQIALRDGVRFHEPVDRELTAEDVVYSFERLAASEHSAHRSLLLDDLGVVHERVGTSASDASGSADDTTAEAEATTATGVADGYVQGSLAVEAVGDRTVELELVEPCHAAASILAHPAFGVVPAGIVGDLSGHTGELSYETFATQSPVGTGPFRFDPDTPDDEFRVVARESYHGETPAVGGVRWTRVPDAETGYERAVAGDADAFRVPDAEYDPDDVTVVTIDDRGRKTGKYGPVDPVGEPLDYQQVCLLATGYVGLNPTRVPKPVRRALAYAVNPTAHATEVHRERAAPAVHLTPPALFPSGRDAAIDHGESYPFDVSESRMDDARKEMESAGYNPANTVSVTFTTDGGETAVRTANRLRDTVRGLPVDLSVETVTPAALRRRRRTGELDLYWANHEFTAPTAEQVLRLFAPGTDAGIVDWHAGGADADSAERAREAWTRFQRHQRDTETDRQVRAEAVRDVEEANWQDVVCLPVVHPLSEVVSYDYVDLSATGATGFARRTLADVRVGPRD